MPDRSADDARAHYALGLEQERLDGALGMVEFARTVEIVTRALPEPPAVIADVGGGPGRYAQWLAGRGYHVEHRDLVPLHVEQTRALTPAAPGRISTEIADARSLDLPDASVDAVLLLGPLYHLYDADDRHQALTEARRIARVGAPVFVAAISAWAPRLHGYLVSKLYEREPRMKELVEQLEVDGIMMPLFDGSFCGYCHRPGELRTELEEAGFSVESMVSVEGLAFALPDLADRMADPVARDAVLDSARAIESVPELLGLGPHLLATCRSAV